MRSPSAGRSGPGWISPGPARRAATSGHSTPGRGTPLRHRPATAPSVKCSPTGPVPVPRRLNSSSSTCLASEALGGNAGRETAGSLGTVSSLGGRSFSTPTGLQLMGSKVEIRSDPRGASQMQQQSTISWCPPPTARGTERSPSPTHFVAAWQFPTGVQSPRAPSMCAPATPGLHASPRALEATGVPASPASYVFGATVSGPIESHCAQEEGRRSRRRSRGTINQPPPSCSAITVAAYPVLPQAVQTQPCIPPTAYVCGSTVAAVPVNHTHQSLPAAQPLLVNEPREDAPVSDLAVDTQSQTCSGTACGAPDTVWRRYLNSSLTAPVAQPSASVVAAAGPCRIMPPVGVPRLPLQGAVAQRCNPDASFSAGLAPTERNTLPPTERAHKSISAAVPAWCAAKTPAEPIACHVDALPPAGKLCTQDISASNSGEQIRLTDSHESGASALCSSSTLQPVTTQNCNDFDGPRTSPNLCHQGTLHHTMGQFGVPEPPHILGMASQQLQASGESCCMPSEMQPSSMPETSVLPSPMPEASTLPDEYGPHSFVVATSPFQQCQNETFVQPSIMDQKDHNCPSHEVQCFGTENLSSCDVSSNKEPFGQPLQPRIRGLPGNTHATNDHIVPLKAVASQDDRRETRKEAVSRKPAKTAKAGAGAESDTNATGADELAMVAAAINLRDLAELRSFRNPPVVVCQVLEPVAVLLGVPHTPWQKMRKLLDATLLGRLSSFDPCHVTAAQEDRVKCLLQAPAFSDGSLHDKCPAAVGLASWCHAVMRLLLLDPPSADLDSGRGTSLASDAPASVRTSRVDGLIVEPDIWSMSKADQSRVRDLQFSREGVGSVRFDGETDVRDVLYNLAEVVLLNPGEVVVYPNPNTKPPIGVGLNKAAEITLYGCMPKTQGFKDQKAKDRYRKRVKQMTESKGAEFVDYDCVRGVWKFRVNHF